MERNVLVMTIGGEPAAIDAACVQSVIELGPVTGAPGAPEHVEGLTSLRSRALTVIDCGRSLGLPRGACEHAGPDVPRLAAVVELDGFSYALAVDGVSDVIALQEPPTATRMALAPGWARASLGMVATPAGPAQLLDPVRLVAGPLPRCTV